MNAILWRAAWLTRWLARISGTLMVLLFLALIIGDGPPPLFRMDAQERAFWFGLLAIFGGLVLAWFYEGWGGLLTLAGWAFLWRIEARAPAGYLVYAPAGIGGLHVVSWAVLRVTRPVAGFRVPGARWIWAGLGLFAALCGNEIFGNPPLMTPVLHPGAGLAGQWKSMPSSTVAGQIEIYRDAAVTGSIGGHRSRDGFGMIEAGSGS